MAVFPLWLIRTDSSIMRKANLPVDGLDGALSRLDEERNRRPTVAVVGEEKKIKGGGGDPQTADLIWTIPTK